MGYYPIPPSQMELIVKYLKLGRKANPIKVHVLDPCCGKGYAIQQLAAALGIPEENAWGVELDRGRYIEATDTLKIAAGMNRVMNASYPGTQITPGSFGLVYLNPPFDTELGGGRREESRFLDLARIHLAPGGVLVFVIPFKQLRNREIINLLDRYFWDTKVWKFMPGDDRKYSEVVVIGQKRPVELPEAAVESMGVLRLQGMPYYPTYDSTLNILGSELYFTLDRYGNQKERVTEPIVFEVPSSWPPHCWKKLTMTDEEIDEAIDKSLIGRLLHFVVPKIQTCPPLPLDRGHIGLALAAGQLDGPVFDEVTGEGHVVRGTARKEPREQPPEYIVNDEKGTVTIVQTIKDCPVMVNRAIDSEGVIYDFTEVVEDDDDEPPPEPPKPDVTATVKEKAAEPKPEPLVVGSLPAPTGRDDHEAGCADAFPRSWCLMIKLPSMHEAEEGPIRFTLRSDADLAATRFLARAPDKTRVDVWASDLEPNDNLDRPRAAIALPPPRREAAAPC